MLGSFQIVLLTSKHIRASFDCGNEALNIFFRKHAQQNSRAGISRTYVLIEGEQNLVSGYYSLASSQVSHTNLPESERKKLPRYPVPTIRLCRLATDLNARGKGFGEALLMDALEKAADISELVGVFGLTVDAKDADAKSFYEKYGFEEFLDNPLHLYLPIFRIKQILGLT